MPGNNTIYNSVTQKLRKERGQNLDAFIYTFMQSVEQSASTDIGEDVIMMKDIKLQTSAAEPPGHNLIFGDLFELNSSQTFHDRTSSAVNQYLIQGPSQCLIYISKYHRL